MCGLSRRFARSSILFDGESVNVITDWLLSTPVTGGEFKKGVWISTINMDADVWFVALLIGRSPMSLKSLPIPPIPEEVVCIARAVFPRGNVVMQIRDTLGTISTDDAFADLFPTRGQPAFAAWRLALHPC